MATTDARPVPRKNTAFRLYFAIRKNDGTLITTWAGQDSEISQDGGSFADCTNEATEIGTSGCGYLELTADEMNADAVLLKITVTNTDALPIVMTLFPEEQGDYRVGAVELDPAARVKLDADQPDYHPATTTELEARTILAANYRQNISLRGTDMTEAKAFDLLLASLAGVTSQPSGTTEKFKFLDGNDAFTTTFDTNGNRTGVALA